MIINNGSFDVDVKAIGYTIDKEGNTVLHKYGSLETVKQWGLDIVDAFLLHGYDDLAKEIRIMEVENLSTEEVDRMINCCTYIGTFLKKQSKISENSSDEQIG